MATSVKGAPWYLTWTPPPRRRTHGAHPPVRQELPILSFLQGSQELEGRVFRRLIGAQGLRAIREGGHTRAVHPTPARRSDANDVALRRALSRGEFIPNGFRSRDVAPLLGPAVPTDPDDRRKHMAKLSRHLHILRAHDVTDMIQRTNRYRLTSAGRTLLTAVLASLDASVTELKQCG